jgi:hypothetical protein
MAIDSHGIPLAVRAKSKALLFTSVGPRSMLQRSSAVSRLKEYQKEKENEKQKPRPLAGWPGSLWSRAKRAAPIYERGGHWMVVD